MTTKGWIPIFSNLSHAVAEWLGWPEGTLFCADTVCKEINRRSGKTMESPFSGPLAGHGDNSVPGTERSACSAASGEQMNNGKCLSDKAPGTRARPREAGISATSGTLFPLRKEDFLTPFFVFELNFYFMPPFRNANKSNKRFTCVFNCFRVESLYLMYFFSVPFPPPSSFHLALQLLWNNSAFEKLDLKKTSIVASNCYIQPFLHLLKSKPAYIE